MGETPIDYAALLDRLDAMDKQMRKEYPTVVAFEGSTLEQDAANAIRALVAENAKLRRECRWHWTPDGFPLPPSTKVLNHD